MERVLTDLDAMLLTVRDAQSKGHIAEAIMAYRMGTLRLAIVGTWIAVAYDILAKIRELRSDGDALAKVFADDFDRQVAADNRPKLLEIERNLISDAEKFGFVGPHDARALRRLFEDRHLCAHPASSQNNELFRPLPDAVRAHIVQAIESVLSMPPISGKNILADFTVDLPSPAFPREQERAKRYVAERYIARMRPTVKRNFAAILIKGLISNTEPLWTGHGSSILDSLDALQQHDRTTFANEYLPEAATLMERSDEAGLLRGVPLLKHYASLRALLPQTVIDRFHAIASSDAGSTEVYSGLGLINSEIDEAILKRIRKASPAEVMAHLLVDANPQFIPAVWDAIRDAENYREGEARLYNATLLQAVMTAEDFARLVDIVGENRQVADAIKSGRYLLAITNFAILQGFADQADWATLRQRTQTFGDYEALWTSLRDSGTFNDVTLEETPF